MLHSTPSQTPHKPRTFSALLMPAATLGMALLFASPAGAQQGAAHPTIAPHHSAVIAGAAYRAPAPVRTSAPQGMHTVSQPRPGWATHPLHFLVAPSSAGVFGPRAAILDSNLRAGFRSRGFIRPFFFGEPFIGVFGVAGSISQFGGLPLGTGLWPACDSSANPGVFWTVGPCFGVGSYSAQLAAAAPPAPYVPPLILFSSPPSGAATQPQQPGPSGPQPAITLYLTDGSTIAAKDWWVSKGHLNYITDSGEAGAVDVLKLDIERTLKENQKRGLEFRLKFTAPSDAYPPSIRP